MCNKKKNSASAATYETLSHMRNDWNGVNPVTKIIPDKRDKNKRKEKEKEMRDI